jgi:hypothetical protein
MPGNARHWLVERIERLLIPELERLGYIRVPLTAEERRSEIATAFPFGRLRRPGPQGSEIIEIQLDKHGRASFRLNLGIAPQEGIVDPYAGHIPPEDIWVHYLPSSYELLQSQVLWRWFSVSRWPWTRATSADYEKLVQEVVRLIPEIETLFRDRKPGAHMRYVNRKANPK